ncbi:MAG: zinc-ribbon domain containing protein [Terracidiphilus sp.]
MRARDQKNKTGAVCRDSYFWPHCSAHGLSDRRIQVLPARRRGLVFAAGLVVVRALVIDCSTKTGKRDRQVLTDMADFNALLVFGKPAMEFKDRVLKCTDCGAEFVFTAGEQLFFHDKQFTNDPKHCKQCKAKRVRGGSRARPETRTNCAQCGETTTVPFKPSQGRPVLCRACFQQVQGKAASASEVAREPRAMQGPS